MPSMSICHLGRDRARPRGSFLETLVDVRHLRLSGALFAISINRRYRVEAFYERTDARIVAHFRTFSPRSF